MRINRIPTTTTGTSPLPLPVDHSIWRTINCFNGNLSDPLRLGRAPWWANKNHVEAVARLDSIMSHLYRTGYHRFLLILPAGYPRGQHLMPSSQWLTMPEERRDALVAMLPRWKREHSDSVIYVYAGFNMANPRRLDMPDPIVVPNITRDWVWFQANWREWIEQCDLDGIGFDYAAKKQNQREFIKVARVLSVAGIRCIGEAVPWRTSFWNRYKYPSPEAFQASWFILESYLAQLDPKRLWRFDPKTTDIRVAFRRTKTIAELRQYLRRGFKIINYSHTNDEAIRTIMATSDHAD